MCGEACIDALQELVGSANRVLGAPQMFAHVRNDLVHSLPLCGAVKRDGLVVRLGPHRLASDCSGDARALLMGLNLD